MSEIFVKSGGFRSEWYADDQLHRDDGPAIEWKTGTKHWFSHGTRHREDGPASVYRDGTKIWWRHGLRHSLDGPAVEDPERGLEEWWVDGVRYRKEDFEKLFHNSHSALKIIGNLLCEYPELVGKTADMIISAETYQQVEIGEHVC